MAVRFPLVAQGLLVTKIQEKLRFLKDRWEERVAVSLDAAELLRYRSNPLGSDLRITNFGGGNTSSKITETDPVEGSIYRWRRKSERFSQPAHDRAHRPQHYCRSYGEHDEG
jgi:hypothetical protein